MGRGLVLKHWTTGGSWSSAKALDHRSLVGRGLVAKALDHRALVGRGPVLTTDHWWVVY